MKRYTESIIGFTIEGIDGEIGKVKELHFDDKTRTIGYLIVETGNWLLGRKVLISPQSVLARNWEEKTITVHLTVEQIKNSPVYQPIPELSESYKANLQNYYGRFISHK